MKASSPIVKHLVLVGGGHSHLAVLRNFAMKPMPGLAITLITRDVVTPYSGSLPGFLAGKYSFDEIHIDLRPLAQFAGARLIQEEIEDIDFDARFIKLTNRPDISFDFLSLNIGSRPDDSLITGADRYATAVKPIDGFIKQWECWREEAVTKIHADESFELVIVGGGPAGVEIAFAIQHRIISELDKRLAQDARLKISIVSTESELLSLHNSNVRQFTQSELQRRNIELKLERTVTEFKPRVAVCADGEELQADAFVYATGASIPQWPFDCGLARSDDGFIRIKDTLQTSSHGYVFAAGDAATVENEPRPKSGVYAVRQGRVLARNLRRFITSKSLQRYFPQRKALALMSMGDGRAIASRGELFFQGRSMGTLKHQIDSRFVKKYSKFPVMPVDLNLEPGLADRKIEKQLKQHAMRCAGCGAKISSDVLNGVLNELDKPTKPEIVTTPGGIEDASRILLEDGRTLVQSIDYIKAFSNDPWLFARIATLHCLSDIHAMGVKPHSALAMLGLPHAEKHYSRQQLRELMQACKSVLNAEDCDLIGGHSAESEELQLGFCVNGFASELPTLNKSGAQTGDAIILTKALGTGALLAADMRYLASHNVMQTAFESMLQSNAQAAEILLSHNATACTDVTGFGLAGHLLEMTNASGCHAELRLQSVNALPGVLEFLEQNIVSSLHHENSLNAQHFSTAGDQSKKPEFELLFDPQTAGGLLASVPSNEVEACLTALHKAGYQAATVIGSFTAGELGAAPIKLID